MTAAGRVRETGRVRFAGPVVIKRDPIRSPVEDRLNRRWSAFAPSVLIGETRYLLRGEPARASELIAGRDLLRRTVWSKIGTPKYGWRLALLNRLRQLGRCFAGPEGFLSTGIIGRVTRLREVVVHVQIHGDATLANLVRVPGFGLRWIDPLDRPYIPGSSLVDVGKMLQSCWGYEGVLCGREPEWDGELAAKIMSGLSEEDRRDAETWLLIHLARLTPYHDADVQRKFVGVIRKYGL